MSTIERSTLSLRDGADGPTLAYRKGAVEILPEFASFEIELDTQGPAEERMAIAGYGYDVAVDVEAICEDAWLVEPQRFRILKPRGVTANGPIAVRHIETGKLVAFIGFRLLASAERKYKNLPPLVELRVEPPAHWHVPDDFGPMPFAKPGVRAFFLPESAAHWIEAEVAA